MPLRFVIDETSTRERIDKVLARLLDRSRATVQRWIREDRVWLDGKPCRPRDVARRGAVLEVEPGPDPLSSAVPDASVPFDVAFEDEHLIVVDKPPGVVVHPARGHREGTLVSGLLARPGFEAAPSDERDREGHLRPGVVHRLDKDTSGLLVVAKTVAAREGLKSQLEAREMTRVYQALTEGVPDSGRIETGYGRDPRSRLRFTSMLSGGRHASTHVSVLEVLAGGRAALVECRLQTGRTHQIRVHLAERRKAPILADATYGVLRSGAIDPELSRVAGQLGRQALHARVLGFEHPVTRERLEFDSGLPDDLATALGELRALSTR